MRPQEAALPLASSTAWLPAATVDGRVTAAIGRCAAVTALSALTMPAPHSPDAGQEHWSDPSVARFGQTGRFPVFAGKAVALASIRATNWAGVKFALIERIRAAIPDTIGAEKLVPKLLFVSLV